MNRRIGAVLLVSLLVVLSGCAGLGGVDDPATTGDAGTAGGEPAGDGTGGESTGDGPALVENRTAALRAAGGYTATWQMEFSEDGAVAGSTTYTHAVDYENERSSFGMLIAGEDGVSSDYETFQADGVSYSRYGAGEDATYSVADAPFAPENTLFAVQSYVADADDLAAFTAAGTETYDGVTVTRYERTDRPSWVAAQGAGNVTWTEFTYAVLVDADGLIRHESWSGDAVDADGGDQTMTFSYSLTEVGSTSVEEPDWAATARDEAGR